MAADLGAGDSTNGSRALHSTHAAGGAVSKVAGAGVVRGHHQLRTAPSLVDTPVLDDVREPDLGSVHVAGGADERVAKLGVEYAGVVGRRPPRYRGDRAGFFERERRREPVAVLRGIGEDLPAAVTGVARGWAEERARRRRIEVVERLRGADREPSELDEGPVGAKVGVRGAGTVVVHTDLQVAAKGPVLGLLAAVEPGIGAGPHQEVLPVEPVLRA